MTPALAGIRVIDVSQGIPGPLCAMVLADMGAEVVKVEPLEGDWMRQIGPFEQTESALFMRLNRNKRGICLDLKHAAGKEAFSRLADGADVVIEGYRSGAMARLGLDYESLAPRNPRLIYCSISAYGSRGPLADTRGSELDVQALMGANRQLGAMGEAPLRIGYDTISTQAAWASGQAIMAALFWRERTGEGQHVETSLLDAAIGILHWTSPSETNPDVWEGSPVTDYVAPPNHGFRCRDRSFLMETGRTDEDWTSLCQALGAPALATDARFATAASRRLNDAALKDAVNTLLATRSFDEVQQLIRARGGTIVPIEDLTSLATHPQVAALGLVKELEHPVAGAYKTLDLPWRFSEPIAELSRVPSPLLGEHTSAVLGELGYAPDAIASLYAAQAVA